MQLMKLSFKIDTHNKEKWKEELTSYFIRSCIIASICMSCKPPNLKKTYLIWGKYMPFIKGKECYGFLFISNAGHNICKCRTDSLNSVQAVTYLEKMNLKKKS